MKILVQHAAQDLPNMIEGEPLLPDDHRNPRLDVARGQTRRLGWSGESSRRFRKIVSPVAIVRFFPKSRLPLPDSFMPYRNEGMSELPLRTFHPSTSRAAVAWPENRLRGCCALELA